ncbi:MAG: glycosyltransferase family 1 protein [Chloroflexi bacterium]|nr:glycosyltransferase family 1 protein [Chloroflexota bacterium]
MKIIVPAIGSRGDVQPYIALCQGLQRAGHAVTLVTNPTLVGLVQGYGVPCAPVGPAVDMGLEGAKIWARSGRNWWLGFLRIMQFGMTLVEKSFPDLIRLVEGAELVVCTDIMAGAAEAEKLGVPWISATLQPGRVPDPQTKPSVWMRAFMPVINRLVMAPVNRFRRRVGAPPAQGDISGMMSKRMVLVPVSRYVSPPNPCWPESVHVTGYWMANAPAEWTPPPNLLKFIAAGEAPIAVSLGAMALSGAATFESARIMLEAIRLAGVRAIVQGWDEALAQQKLPDTIYHAGAMPHSWLFEQVRAVVHHGGFGTTASAFYAGKPAVVVPHIIDQLYWADVVYRRGAGPRPITRHDLTVERLAAAICQAVSDESLQACAAQLGEKIRSEPDGVQAAVSLIESLQ